MMPHAKISMSRVPYVEQGDKSLFDLGIKDNEGWEFSPSEDTKKKGKGIIHRLRNRATCLYNLCRSFNRR